MKRRGSKGPVDTIYGRFSRRSTRRLNLTFDYEAPAISAFRRIGIAIAPSLMLDIGANIGVYSVYLAELASLKRILAFEPTPRAFRFLERNADLQGGGKITCHNEALSDETGTAHFALYGTMAGNNTLLTGSSSTGEPAPETIEVSTATLDDRIVAEGETFIAKIDVEGHEQRVLAGAHGFLSRNSGVLQIEIFRDLAMLEEALALHGYTRIFRMGSDYYFSNLSDPAQKADVEAILFDEVALALSVLKEARLERRRAAKTRRISFLPLLDGHDPALRRR